MKLIYTLFSGVCAMSLTLSLNAQDTPAPAPSTTTEEAQSDDPFEGNAFLKSLNWKTEGTGDLETWAQIKIPEGFRHLQGADTARLMRELGNLPESYEGMIAVDDLNWFVVFQHDSSGYVKDDEKDDLDPDKLLEQLKEADEPSNEQRKAAGLAQLYTVGWTVEPKYNEETNNLEWGLLLRDSNGSKSVNYQTKLLGRHGVMHVTLVCDPEDLEKILPTYQKLLTGFSYKEGKTYEDFEEGDKVAAYGLTALVAGGAIYGAAKLGFFAKFWKYIVAGVVAVGAFFKRIFGGLFGGKSDGRIS